MHRDPLVLILLYFILPLWLLAGLADWQRHRATHIETTSGLKESLLHLLQFGEIGLVLLPALFLQINAGIIALMLAMFLLHEATALWDVGYAIDRRRIGPAEQHIHSFLEMLPLAAIICVAALHWGQFQALFGLGPEPARFTIGWKADPLEPAYLLGLMAFVLLLVVIPYGEELIRCARARRRA